MKLNHNCSMYDILQRNTTMLCKTIGSDIYDDVIVSENTLKQGVYFADKRTCKTD